MVKKSKMLQEVDRLVKLNGLPDEISLVQSNKSSYYIILMFMLFIILRQLKNLNISIRKMLLIVYHNNYIFNNK